MKKETFLFIFAHPDDETVAAAGTIQKLVAQGHDVHVVSVTDGGAGEISAKSAAKNPNVSIHQFRKQEAEAVARHLGLREFRFLDIPDGSMSNQHVWGELTTAILDLLDELKPSVVVTFEHGGWYFHLDHVGVSIATTLAVHQTEVPIDAFLLSHVRIEGTHWPYVFHTHEPITHQVLVDDIEFKRQALLLHESQNLDPVLEQLEAGVPHYELFQLAKATARGHELLRSLQVFEVL